MAPFPQLARAASSRGALKGFHELLDLAAGTEETWDGNLQPEELFTRTERSKWSWADGYRKVRGGGFLHRSLLDECSFSGE